MTSVQRTATNGPDTGAGTGDGAGTEPSVPAVHRTRSILVGVACTWLAVIVLAAVFADVLPLAPYDRPAESIQSQLSTFKNVTMKIKVVDYAEFLPLQTSHNFDMVVSSAAFNDPEPRLWTAFQGDSPTNMTGINDAQLDQALLKGRTATTVADRKAAYETVQRRLVALRPMLWIGRTAGSAISGKNVGGLTQYGFGSLLPEDLWIKH
ncbi:hypothetical protein ACWGKQ_14515 [Streptomyces sp. NPDC054770]